MTRKAERLTDPPWKSREPYWLPDSRRIIYEFWGAQGHQVCTMDVDDLGSTGVCSPAQKEPSRVAFEATEGPSS